MRIVSSLSSPGKFQSSRVFTCLKRKEKKRRGVKDMCLGAFNQVKIIQGLYMFEEKGKKRGFKDMCDMGAFLTRLRLSCLVNVCHRQ